MVVVAFTVTFVYSLLIVVRAVRAARERLVADDGSFVFFSVCTTNDVARFFVLIPGGLRLGHWGFLGFCIGMAIVIGNQYSRMMQSLAKLSTGLEAEVASQTSQLRAQNEQLLPPGRGAALARRAQAPVLHERVARAAHAADAHPRLRARAPGALPRGWRPRGGARPRRDPAQRGAPPARDQRSARRVAPRGRADDARGGARRSRLAGARRGGELRAGASGRRRPAARGGGADGARDRVAGLRQGPQGGLQPAVERLQVHQRVDRRRDGAGEGAGRRARRHRGGGQRGRHPGGVSRAHLRAVPAGRQLVDASLRGDGHRPRAGEGADGAARRHGERQVDPRRRVHLHRGVPDGPRAPARRPGQGAAGALGGRRGGARRLGAQRLDPRAHPDLARAVRPERRDPRRGGPPRPARVPDAPPLRVPRARRRRRQAGARLHRGAGAAARRQRRHDAQHGRLRAVRGHQGQRRDCARAGDPADGAGGPRAEGAGARRASRRLPDEAVPRRGAARAGAQPPRHPAPERRAAPARGRGARGEPRGSR